MNARIENMQKYIDGLNDAGVRRTYFYPLVYASLKETRNEPTQIRRAKAQAYLLDNAPLAVLSYELLAGSMAAFCPVEQDVPPYEIQKQAAISLLETYLSEKRWQEGQKTDNKKRIKTFEEEFTTKESRWALMSRVHHDANITYKELQRLISDMEAHFSVQKDLEKYEIGRELERSFKIDYGKAVKQELDSLPWFAANHLSLNYGRIMKQGFGNLLAGIDEKLKNALGEQKEYFTAAKIAAEAASRFMMRYARKLQEHSNVEDEPRKTELIQMADICSKLALKKAETFREGVQFVWMLHIMASILWGSALSFGRFDQYMGALYENDIAKGVITRNEAKELLCCMWLKVNEPRMRTVQSMTVGGITPEGENGVNMLTELCLEVIKEMKLPYPNVGVRINKKNPEGLYDKVVDSVKEGCGQPMIMTDEVWIENLKKLGYDDKYANDYYHMGCVEIMIPGKQPNWGVTDPIAFPMLYENVFARYRAGEIKLDSFEDFQQAYAAELQTAVTADKYEADGKNKDMPGKCYDPFASLMTDGCLESGRDMFQGGSELGTHWSFYAYGLGTAADSMAAVKKFVYDEKRLTISQMAEVLYKNFEGYENMRCMLDSKTPSYGNDIDDVDMLANYILSNFNRMVLELNSKEDRDKYVSTLFGYFFHIYHGEITGATANGRKRGEPFSDSMGPSQGKDRNGPTKLLNSVLKLDHGGVTGGYALNLKINPGLVKDKAGTMALKALIKSYVEECGPQLQINFVDAESLKKAKKDPDKYRNLIVRIGGYCEYFVNLDGALQDEIITRTIHGL